MKISGFISSPGASDDIHEAFGLIDLNTPKKGNIGVVVYFIDHDNSPYHFFGD